MNKIIPSCSRVRVQVDLLDDFPDYVKMEIFISISEVSRIERVKIQYDYLPKYYKRCMLQGHNDVECRVLHPELRKVYDEDENNHSKNKQKNRDTERK